MHFIFGANPCDDSFLNNFYFLFKSKKELAWMNQWLTVKVTLEQTLMFTPSGMRGIKSFVSVVSFLPERQCYKKLNVHVHQAYIECLHEHAFTIFVNTA